MEKTYFGNYVYVLEMMSGIADHLARTASVLRGSTALSVNNAVCN